MNKTAVIYARVSTKGQVEEEVSLPAQVEGAERLAGELGATVLRVFLDEGRSAFKADNRPDFKAAIDYALTRGVAYFITWSSSRFARNKIEAALYKRELDRAGVRLVYVSARVDRDTNEGWLYDSVMEVFDELRSRDTSKDTRRSLIHNAEQGYWVGGLAPFGYASVPAPDNPKRRKLVQVPDEAVRVREIFQQRLQGLGGKQIAARYNAAGVQYRGRRWQKKTVLDLLRNPAMLGQTIFNHTDPRTRQRLPREAWIVLQTHEPIVDRATWDQVAALMDAATTTEGRGATHSSHPFTGLLRCEHCGGTLVLETATGRSARYEYYNCRRAVHDGGCVSRRWPAAPLDEFLNGVIFDRLLDRETLGELARELAAASGKWQAEQHAKREALQARVAGLRDRNRRLYDVLELQGVDAPNLGDLAQRLRANNAEIKSLEGELLQLEDAAPPANGLDGLDLTDLGADIRALFTERASAPRLRAIYQGCVLGITLRGDQAEIDYDPGQLVAIANPVHSQEIWGGMGFFLRTARLVVPLGPGLASRRRINPSRAAGVPRSRSPARAAS